MKNSKVKLSEGETARIIRELPNGQPVELSFGPRGVWLDVADPINDRAVDILCEIRGVERKKQGASA